jgi:Domain of unknown function (DUF4263)
MDLMKKIRSDSNLRWLLELTYRLAASEQVRACIKDAVEHAGGTRGNRVLLDLLTFAIQQAEIAGDADTVARLNDAFGYATGRVLSTEIECKYQLLDGAQDRATGLVDLIYSNAHLAAASLFDEYLGDHPDACVADAREHFARLAKTSIQVVEDRKSGRYQVLRHDTESQIWLAETMLERISFADPEPPADAALPQECLTLLNRTDAATIMAAMAVRLRRSQLRRARRIIEHPYSSERQIQNVLSGSWWLFGGEYVGESLRRRITTGLELDIPLIRPDGVLHIVELKRASVAVVRRHRGETILTAAVHEAVGQVMNYLRLLDERRDAILADFQIDTRRARATVVIGHPGLQNEVEEAVIGEALRTYNSHLARIEVITYKQLLDGAERALELAG